MNYNSKPFRHLFFILFFGFFQSVIYAQSISNKEYLFNNIKRSIYSNPTKSLNIAHYFLNGSNITVQDKAKINFLIAETYLAKSDYEKTLEFLFKERKYNEYLSEKESFTVEMNKIMILRELLLKTQSKSRLKTLEERTTEISDITLKAYFETEISIEKSNYFLKNNQFEEGIKLLQLQEQSAKSAFKHFPDLQVSYTLALGKLLLGNHDLTKADLKFEEALTLLKKQKDVNLYDQAFALSGIADVYFLQKKYTEAIPLLEEALSDSKKLSNLFLQVKILQQQKDVFLALKQIADYKLTATCLFYVSTDCTTITHNAINSAYNLISDENSAISIELRNRYFKILYCVILIGVLIVLFYVIFWIRISKKEKGLDEVIKFIQITKDNFISKTLVNKPDSKKKIILKETEEEILKKLKRFENSKRFLTNDISLAVLAGQLGTNTKYLSETLNSHYNINFNTYINTLRINHITEKIKTDPNFVNYKISYLAEYCGFATHSSFATIFKSIAGISPVKFIELVNKEKNNTIV